MRPLTVFRADLIGCDQTSWEDLFDGFTSLRAITFSSSLEMLLRLAERFDDLEIVFGSESMLSREQEQHWIECRSDGHSQDQAKSGDSHSSAWRKEPPRFQGGQVQGGDRTTVRPC